MERNRGFSLVELMVTMAILSVVMVIAMSFMMTGSRSFTKGNADSTVQKEAELTVNQIEDMIIDLNGGVSMTDDAAKTELSMYHAEDDGSGSMVYSKSAVRWDKSDNNVYCSKWDVSYDASTGAFTDGAAEYADQLLAEHVTDFKVDLSDTQTTKAMDGTMRTIVKSVLVSVGYDDGTGVVDYATSPVITLRNRMLLSDNPANIFDERKPMADTLKLHYSGPETAGAVVPIVDRVSEVTRGASYNIYARINSGSDVNELVDWVIEESGTLSTIDANGYLTVGAYEANAYLTITAQYKSNPNKKATGVVKVVGTTPLKSLDAVHIVTLGMEPFAPQFEAIPVTRGFTQDEEDAITYQWTVNVEGGGRELSDVVEPFTDNQKTLALTIKKEEANYGKVLVIQVQAHSDVTGQAPVDIIRYRIDTNGAVSGDASMKRGESASWRHYAMSDEWAETATYDFCFCDQYGNEISVDPSLRDSIELVKTSWNAYQLSCKETLPINQEYYIKVIGYYEGWRNNFKTTWTKERIHYIPAVQLYGKTCYNKFKFGNGNFTFNYTMIGYKELQLSAGENKVENSRVEYTVENFDYSAPEGVTVTAKVVQDEARGTNRVWAMGEFECSDWSKAGEVTLKSLTIRVAAKADTNINALVTIIFEQP